MGEDKNSIDMKTTMLYVANLFAPLVKGSNSDIVNSMNDSSSLSQFSIRKW